MTQRLYIIGPWQREITVLDKKGNPTTYPAPAGLQTPLFVAEYAALGQRGVVRCEDVTGQESRDVPRLPCDLVVLDVWCDDKTATKVGKDERFKVVIAGDMGKPPIVAAVTELEAWLGKAGMAEAAIGRVTDGAKTGRVRQVELVQKIITEAGGKAKLTTASVAVADVGDVARPSTKARRARR